ncbi:hypothetical protein [Metabacillus niabensis]|uniref:hypothetical protein n=1 Tax=Metabacillus niabensis TaxID=324854 RepID=UPI001CFBBFF8|nr:hypothetical protein [Metabacillus niabensis]
MEKKYSTNILFSCTLKDIGENSDAIDLMESRLNQCLTLLSTVINIITSNEGLSVEAKDYMNRFENIKRFNDQKLPLHSEEVWSIEEFTLLTIMLRSITRKRYSSMNNTILTYIGSDKPLSDKVTNANRQWLLEAYKCLGVLKHYKWSKDIDKDLQKTLFGSDFNFTERLLQIQEVESNIKKSDVLEGEIDSVIGQVLAKCAYPELLEENRRSSATKLIDTIAKVIYALEKVEGIMPQEIAIIESIKKISKLREDIEYNYDVSKYYTDKYWENVMDSEENEADLLKIKKQLTGEFSVEMDTIEKNTL